MRVALIATYRTVFTKKKLYFRKVCSDRENLYLCAILCFQTLVNFSAIVVDRKLIYSIIGIIYSPGQK